MRSAELPPDAGVVLTALARAAIAERLGVTWAAAPVAATQSAAWLDTVAACFVTLTQTGRLRGCIGTLEAVRPLGVEVRRSAVNAACHDRRFPPLTADELTVTAIEVSVLSAVEPMPVTSESDAVARLRPGIDGVVLEWRGHRGTYLPQVWDAVGDPAAFLDSLKTKAGLSADFWSPDVRLSRYTVAEFHEEAP